MSTVYRKLSSLHAMRLGLASIQLVIILAVIGLFAGPPPILVTLGVPQSVKTLNPKVGIHTRLSDEVEDWKIAKSLELVREMGAPWIVEYFPWSYIESQKGQFDWSHADSVVDHARAQGITVIARLGFVPTWARPKDSVTSFIDTDHLSDYGNFVAAFTEHFKDRVGYLIVWNEPNTNFEWGERPVDPAAYVRLLQVAYTRAKEKNPSVKILAGALAPNLAPPGSTDTMNDLEYLDKMYGAGAKDYFDILAAHSYGWKATPDEKPSANSVNLRRTELLHAIMVSHGDAGKHVIITEGGWNDHPRWTKAVTPSERIRFTLGAYDWCATTDWIDACAFWAFRYPAPTYTFNDYWTFVTPDFVLKPIYLEIQKYTGNAGPNG